MAIIKLVKDFSNDDDYRTKSIDHRFNSNSIQRYTLTTLKDGEQLVEGVFTDCTNFKYSSEHSWTKESWENFIKVLEAEFTDEPT